jgi:hypothetical protein
VKVVIKGMAGYQEKESHKQEKQDMASVKRRQQGQGRASSAEQDTSRRGKASKTGYGIMERDGGRKQERGNRERE